jgi:hypothetical protein
VFVHDVEGAFEGDRGAAECAFIEEAADQRYAVGYTPERREFGQRMGGIGGPVAACFRDFDKAGAQRQRRVAGEVCDGEDLAAQGGHQQHIHLAEESRHLDCDTAAKAVALDEIDGGKKARLAEEIGPGVEDLGLEVLEAAGEGEFFEGCGGLGEENQLERVVGPVGERHFDGRHAELAESLEGRSGFRQDVYFAIRQRPHGGERAGDDADAAPSEPGTLRQAVHHAGGRRRFRGAAVARELRRSRVHQLTRPLSGNAT